MKRIHVSAFVVVLRLRGGRTRNVRRPAELLPWRILHPEDPIKRHIGYMITRTSYKKFGFIKVASRRPNSIQRSILVGFHTIASRTFPSRRDGSTLITFSAALARLPRITTC